MKIAIIGTGYVGLTSALCFAYRGHDVICVDKNEDKINKLKNNQPTIFEKKLPEILATVITNKKIDFTTDLARAVKESSIIILAVGTPQGFDGNADLSYIFEATREIAGYVDEYKLFITKSTVPIGTNHLIQKTIEEISKIKIDIASNPEFMREGFAIDDFLMPDRIVIGIDNQDCQKLIKQLYQPWIADQFPIFFTNIITAELIKYCSNAFLMTKVAFINEIENLANKIGANIKDVSYGMGLDKRIGAAFLNPGPGIGGSCFPKDSLALDYIANKNSIKLSIIQQVIASNNQRFHDCALRIMQSCQNHNNSRDIAILGLAFKAQTDDVRMSPAIEIIKILLAHNFTVSAYDPEATDNAKKILQDSINYCSSIAECYNKSSNIAILTEWQEFKSIKTFADFSSKNVIDLRYFL